jgi:hypothetical protein
MEEKNEPKAGQIDRRIFELVKAFDEFRKDNDITVTETLMLLTVLKMKVKSEIDSRKTQSFMQNFCMNGIMDTMKGILG